jgi:hypothetical protein
MLEADTAGHRTACHFWREIEPPERLLPAVEELTVNPDLAKLQAFFTQRSGVGAAASNEA